MIFKLSCKLKGDNQDIVREKYLRMMVPISFSIPDKLTAWKDHYKCLLKIEFPWDAAILDDPLLEGPPSQVTQSMVSTALKTTRSGKAPRLSGIIVEMFSTGGSNIEDRITTLANAIIHENWIPSERSHTYIINCYKRKGVAIENENYRGFKLLHLPLNRHRWYGHLLKMEMISG